MPSSCPICEQPIASTATHCGVCGFPTILAVEGLRSATESEPAPDTFADDAPSKAPRPQRVAPRPSPQADTCAAIAEDLQKKLALVHELDGESPEVSSEMCHAALTQADGRVGEALDVLRNAQVRIGEQTRDLFDRRLTQLEEREKEFRADGLMVRLGPSVVKLRADFEDGNREAALTFLASVNQRIAQFDSDWKGTKGLLGQIDRLRQEARGVGIPLGEIDDDVARIREQVEKLDLDSDKLDAIAQGAAQTLMLLHEAIPSSLESELSQHSDLLETFPEDHLPSEKARRLHAEVSRHLKKGRLSDALGRVRELRREIEGLRDLAREMAAEPTPPPETGIGAPPMGVPLRRPKAMETTGEALDRLLKKARSLAARVRTLAPDSDVAYEASAEIRRATELLRARKLEEADVTLTRLMRTLSTEPREVQHA